MPKDKKFIFLEETEALFALKSILLDILQVLEIEDELWEKISGSFKNTFYDIKIDKYKINLDDFEKWAEKETLSLINDGLTELVKEGVVDLLLNENGEFIYSLNEKYKKDIEE